MWGGGRNFLAYIENERQNKIVCLFNVILVLTNGKYNVFFGGRETCPLKK